MPDRNDDDMPGLWGGRSEHPPPALDDPRVDDVPDTTPRPGEEEAEAAARLARDSAPEQDAWGAPEDRPDHEGNEVYEQQDEPGS